MREGPPAPRGRGAGRNVKSRFDRYETVPVEDGLAPAESDPRTTLIADRARSIVTPVTVSMCRASDSPSWSPRRDSLATACVGSLRTRAP